MKQELTQNPGRRKRAAEKLAQEIFGNKKGRASAPPTGPKAGLGGSLASRVGVTKGVCDMEYGFPASY